MIIFVKTEHDKARVADYLAKLPEGKKYRVAISINREKRSVDQNALYWLWLNCISDETGNDKDDLHEYFKGKFIGFDDKIIFNQLQRRAKSTTELNTKMFTDYLERIRAFAASELAIILPDPEDKYWQEFYEKYKDFI